MGESEQKGVIPLLKRVDSAYIQWNLHFIHTVEVRFLKKFHETPFYKKKEGFWCTFVLSQWEKVSFSG